MIKVKMVDMIKAIKIAKGYTYSELEVLSGLSRSQLYDILRKGGECSSTDLLEKCLNNLGYEVKVSITEKISNEY